MTGWPLFVLIMFGVLIAAVAWAWLMDVLENWDD